MTDLAASDYLEDALLKHILKNDSYTSPATVYVALYTDDPSDNDTGTEVSGNAYARQTLTVGDVYNDAAGLYKDVSSNGNILFPVATGGAWGTITHIGIRDAVTEDPDAGNLLFHGALDASVVIGEGNRFAILDKDLVIKMG